MVIFIESDYFVYIHTTYNSIYNIVYINTEYVFSNQNQNDIYTYIYPGYVENVIFYIYVSLYFFMSLRTSILISILVLSVLLSLPVDVLG